MGREAFADTSALYGIVDRKDSAHAVAVAAVARLTAAGRKIVTTDYVVAEALNLAAARGGSNVAVRLLELLERSSGIRIEWIGTDRFDTAKDFYRKHADHAYSFTDCTSFVVMQELHLTDALTLDRHFREAGFKIIS